MNILGINAYHGDVSAVLLQDGALTAAVEEERFTRIKHCAGLPEFAIRECLRIGGVRPKEIDAIAISRNPRANLGKKLLFTLKNRPGIDMLTDRVKNTVRVGGIANALSQMLDVDESVWNSRIHWIEHHPAHLASSFLVSPFDEAAVCAIDGFGDFVSTSTAIGRGGKIEILDKAYFPYSLGVFYLAITQYLGFPKYGDEFKVMGLAPYGEPEFVNELRKLIRLLPDGCFELDLSYFLHHNGGQGQFMTWDSGEPVLAPVFSHKLEELLGAARKPSEPLESRHEAIAASLQAVFEEAAFHVLNALYNRTKLPRLCLAGGCAMNSVANGKLRENTPFREIYIQPAAGDNGTALGAAFFVWNSELEHERDFVMQHAYWGPEFTQAQMDEALEAHRGELERRRCAIRRIENEDQLCSWTAEQISQPRIVGWFQGRMEWGARALGNRSILADPRRSDMREIINTRIKFREKFRPFAPSAMEEALDEYFAGACADPFMIQVYPVRPEKRAAIPAVTHVDGSGRLQTVGREANPLFWKLLNAFREKTGVPMLLNTSFNENEPIVHRPEEAMNCFLRTNMDALVLGNCTVLKGDASLPRPL